MWALTSLGAVALALASLSGCSTTNVYGGGGMGPGSAMMGAARAGDSPWVACSPASALPGATVTVLVADMRMSHMMMAGASRFGSHMMLRAVPSVVPAGTVSVLVENMGWSTHEVVVLPLGGAASVGERVPGADGTVDESGSVGEVSNTCGPGVGEGVQPRSAGWATMTLAPGRYELLCNEPDHYAAGMYAELDVTG